MNEILMGAESHRSQVRRIVSQYERNNPLLKQFPDGSSVKLFVPNGGCQLSAWQAQSQQAE